MNTKAAPIVLLDQDSTLVDWDDSGYNHNALLLDPTITPVSRELRTSYGWMAESDHHPELRTKALNAPGFYRNLVPYEGAIKAVQEMRQAGINVFILTTPYATHDSCASEKYANVAEHFGRDMIEKTILSYDKTLVSGAILVDDKPIIKGAMTPTWNRIFFDQPYNAQLPGPRLHHWDKWESVIIPELELLGY
jgi:5'-nucleotidase